MSLNLTTKRKQILDVLKKSSTTLSVSEIHTGLPEMDMTTIYRNLDLFVREGIIKKVYLGTEEARFEYQREPHHHAICTDCQKVIHFTAPNDKIEKMLDLRGFLVDEMEITVRGHCSHRRK